MQSLCLKCNAPFLARTHANDIVCGKRPGEEPTSTKNAVGGNVFLRYANEALLYFTPQGLHRGWNLPGPLLHCTVSTLYHMRVTSHTELS